MNSLEIFIRAIQDALKFSASHTRQIPHINQKNVVISEKNIHAIKIIFTPFDRELKTLQDDVFEISVLHLEVCKLKNLRDDQMT